MVAKREDKGSFSRLGLAVLLAGMMVAGQVRVGQAEPCLRISKKGVIYYYFSSREEHRGGQVPEAGISRVISPQARRIPVKHLEPLIQEASRQQSLPPALVKAVIRVESNFNPAATSPKGAQGLMQLMPQTAAELQVVNPYDIQENVWAGTRYLGMLLRKFNYRLHLALAAYNAGPQRVEQWQDVPPIRETQDFVRDVCRNFLELDEKKPGQP